MPTAAGSCLYLFLLLQLPLVSFGLVVQPVAPRGKLPPLPTKAFDWDSNAHHSGPPKPTPPPFAPGLHRRAGDIPDGVSLIGGLPAPACFIQNATDVRQRSTAVAPGILWAVGLPWAEAGQVVWVRTDTDGAKLEGIAIENDIAELKNYTSLLQPYSNSSGWSMTMPESVYGRISAPTVSWTGSAKNSAYNLLMTVSWDCHKDKYAPVTSEAPRSELPMVNPFLNLPAISQCTKNDTRTATFSSTMVIRTGEVIIPAYQGENISDFWNQTGAVWTISSGGGNSSANGSQSGVIFEPPKYFMGGDDPALLFHLQPGSTAFNFTVPAFTGTPSFPGLIVTATSSSGVKYPIQSYTLTASASFPCWYDRYANGIYQGDIPCKRNDPLFQTGTDNWIYREVDLSLSNYWYNSPTRTTPSAPNVPGPTATSSNDKADALPKQLAWHALNVHVDCSLAGQCIDQSAIDFCQQDTTPTLPAWSYLALMGISNLHTQFKNIYDQLSTAAWQVGFWGLDFVTEFTNDVEKTAELTQSEVALAATGMVVSVFAAFIPLINVGKVAANVRTVEAKLGKPGDRSFLPFPANPKAPVSNLKPDDPTPPKDSDISAYMSGGRQTPDDPFVGPDHKITDFAYVEGNPLRSPRLPQPASEGRSESKSPDIGRRETTVLLGTIPGSVLTSSQTLWSKYDPNTVNVAAQAGIWQSFVSNITQDMQKQLDLFLTAMMTDPDMTDVLLTYLWAGSYISGQIDLSLLQWFLRTDMLARTINNLWQSYYTYVSFTFLNDPVWGNVTTACNNHKAGPQSTKYCGVGGVFYTYTISQYTSGQATTWVQGGDTDFTPLPSLVMPYGLDKFESDERVNITQNAPTEGSARAWNATQIVGISTADSNAMNSNVGGLFSTTALQDLYGVIGRLPGEWTLPVCDQGSNTWGGEYMVKGGKYAGSLPCACGYQGNETTNFYDALGLNDMDLYYVALYCCEGSLLFPKENPHATAKITPNTGPGASGLRGGVWPDNKPLKYGKRNGKDLVCVKGGTLKEV